TITITGSKAGKLHWGTNGWNLPSQNYWPQGTVAYSDGKSVETVLDPNKKIVTGPFNGINKVTQINFIFHYDDNSWAGEDIIPITSLPTDTDPPAIPGNVTITAGNGYIDLKWNANTELDLAGYNVYRSLSTDGDYIKINGNLITQNFYRITGLMNGTNYYFIVKAVDNWSPQNESDSSAVVSGKPALVDIIAPLAPKNLCASGQVEQIVLNWSKNLETDLSGYKIYRTQTSGSNYVLIKNITDSNVSSFTDTNVAAGHIYYYVLKAFDNAIPSNLSLYSNETSALVLEVHPPNPPTGLNGTAGNRMLTLTWTVPSGQYSGFNVYNLQSGGVLVKVNSDTITTNSFTINDINRVPLTNGTIYAFTVKTVSSRGVESSVNQEIRLMPVGLIDVMFIINMQTQSGFNYVRIAGDSLTPSWSPSSNELNYYGDSLYYITLQLLPSMNLQYKFIKAVPTNANWEKDFGVYPDNNRILTILDQGLNKMVVKTSWESSLYTSLPSVPSSLTATSGNNQVSLNWTIQRTPDITGVNIYRNGIKIAYIQSGNAYIDTGAVNNNSYNYYVKSVSITGIESEASNFISAVPVSPNKNGRISTNTTWDLLHSPYIIDGDLIIDTGIKLTIEPGVICQVNLVDNNNLGFNSSKIEIILCQNAGIISGGSVLFTSNSGTPQSGDWQGIVAAGSISDTLNNLIIEYASVGFELQNSAKLFKNTVYKNSTGVLIKNHNAAVSYCDITHNTTGIRIYGSSLNPRINFNNIFNNSGYSVENNNSGIVDAVNNWWGTTVIANIESKIYDSSDNAGVGKVNYMPVRTGIVDMIAPSYPENFSAQSGDRTVSLKWSAGSDTDIIGYNIYRKTSGEFIKINSSYIYSVFYNDLNLTNGTEYYYKISAVDISGNESLKSAEVYAVPRSINVVLEDRIIDGDFLDWKYADVRALDNCQDQYRLEDGYDDCRDIVALYSREGVNNYYFRIDLYELGINSEQNYLDIYFAIDFVSGGQVWLPDFMECQTTTDNAWELCAAIYNGTNYKLFKSDWSEINNGIT
ncbi:hypothetical protein KA977_14490, partial [Candidatus Dependentiae bacterium]|nr:hypothetical protein [Candidatus Dependentiae bacterium]